ncbi:hypothetical protein U2F10_17955 [Leptothoe sp. EHU-05/26/07-4]
MKKLKSPGEKKFFRAGYTVAIGLLAYLISSELSLGKVTDMFHIVSLIVVATGLLQFSFFFLTLAKSAPTNKSPNSRSFLDPPIQAQSQSLGEDINSSGEQ